MLAAAGKGRPYWGPRWCVAIGLVISLASVDPTAAGASSPLEERFFREAPRAWKQYQDFWLTLEGASRGVRREKRSEKLVEMDLRQSWKHCNGNTLTEIENLAADSWGGKVQGENSEYIFVLVRDKPAKPWVIQEVAKKTTKGPTTPLDYPNVRAQGLTLGDGLPPFPVFFSNEGFKVVEIAPDEMGGEGLVRLRFTVPPKDTVRLTGGRLLLDPSHDWIIRHAELERDLGEGVDGAGKCTLQTDYKEGADHHPVVTRATMKCTYWEKARITTEVETFVDFDLRQRTFIPESEFTLSAYGFPEPFLAPPKHTPWYLWLGLAGMLCLLLGAAVAWRKRRQAA